MKMCSDQHLWAIRTKWFEVMNQAARRKKKGKQQNNMSSLLLCRVRSPSVSVCLTLIRAQFHPNWKFLDHTETDMNMKLYTMTAISAMLKRSVNSKLLVSFFSLTSSMMHKLRGVQCCNMYAIWEVSKVKELKLPTAVLLKKKYNKKHDRKRHFQLCVVLYSFRLHSLLYLFDSR